MEILAGSVDVSIDVRAMSATDGSALTGLTASSFTAWYRRSVGKQTIALSNVSSLGAVHSDGGMYEISDGWYRLDLPDAACAAGVRSVSIGGTVSGGILLTSPIVLATLTETLIATAVDAKLSNEHGFGDWTDVLGPGGTNFEIEATTEDGVPIDGVEVWVSTDIAGNTVIAGTLYTDANGLAEFMLDPGTYYLWKQLAGYSFTNPQLITVT